MFLKNLHWVGLILTIVFFGGGYLNYESFVPNSNLLSFFVSCVSNIHISIFEPNEDNYNLFAVLIFIAFLFSYLGSIFSMYSDIDVFEPDFTFLDWIKLILVLNAFVISLFFIFINLNGFGLLVSIFIGVVNAIIYLQNDFEVSVFGITKNYTRYLNINRKRKTKIKNWKNLYNNKLKNKYE